MFRIPGFAGLPLCVYWVFCLVSPNEALVYTHTIKHR